MQFKYAKQLKFKNGSIIRIGNVSKQNQLKGSHTDLFMGYPKKKKSDGWFIGLLLIIAFIILIGLIMSVDWQACADSPKGFCE